MKYSVTKLNSISKLTIYEIFYKSPRNLSSMFWDKILNYQYFFDFIYKKYLPSKIKNWEISKKELSNINYFLKQLKTIKSKINLLQHEQIRPQDLFLSYVIFTKIVSIPFGRNFNNPVLEVAFELRELVTSIDALPEPVIIFVLIKSTFLNTRQEVFVTIDIFWLWLPDVKLIFWGETVKVGNTPFWVNNTIVESTPVPLTTILSVLGNTLLLGSQITLTELLSTPEVGVILMKELDL